MNDYGLVSVVGLFTLYVRIHIRHLAQFHCGNDARECGA